MDESLTNIAIAVQDLSIALLEQMRRFRELSVAVLNLRKTVSCEAGGLQTSRKLPKELCKMSRARRLMRVRPQVRRAVL